MSAGDFHIYRPTADGGGALCGYQPKTTKSGKLAKVESTGENCHACQEATKPTDGED